MIPAPIIIELIQQIIFVFDSYTSVVTEWTYPDYMLHKSGFLIIVHDPTVRPAKTSPFLELDDACAVVCFTACDVN